MVPSAARSPLALVASVAACLGGLAACAGSQQRGPAFDPEGRVIRAVAIEGNEAFSDDSIESKLALREPRGFGGETTIFDQLSFEIDRKRVEAFYRERGYFDAKVISAERLKMPFGQVGIRYRVVEGARTRITSICVVVAPSGDCSADRDLIEASELEVGDRFD